MKDVKISLVNKVTHTSIANFDDVCIMSKVAKLIGAVTVMVISY